MPAEGGRSRRISTGDRSQLDPNWSPDGKRLVFGGSQPDHSADRPIQIHILDLDSREVSTVPGSEGLFSPRWSPDGRSIAALSADLHRLVLYEFATGRWRELVKGTDGFAYPDWTHDGTHVQLLRGFTIVRVRASDGAIAPVASLDGVTLVLTEIDSWLGLDPDDSPLVLREVTPGPEIYALEVEWP